VAAAQGQPASGPPKILLLFDASGSMRTNSGDGTPKIQVAQDAAVALLDELPPQTEIGLRVFGGGRPSRPIGPACQDSRLVLPVGALDRAGAEEQIRSFRARGRTPLAYALERSLEDLGDSGSRTIIVVSDGEDTCQPPPPCEVAEEIAQGGVELRIQAIGFNVDRAARRELECIAQAGGGIYRDADDAEELREELRTLSTRALREYRARGKPIKGGAARTEAPALGPGQYVDAMPPDSERWYAIDLAQGETLKASVSLIAPTRDLPTAADGVNASLDIVTPAQQIPEVQNSSASSNPFERRGYVDAMGVVTRPIGVGQQASEDEPFHEPGRYYLKLALEDTDSKDLFNAIGGEPVNVELAVEVLGRRGGSPSVPKQEEEEPPDATPNPDEPPSAPLLGAVGGGLAALGFAIGAALRRRRP
jgi:Ca-activated chloride channel family protein